MKPAKTLPSLICCLLLLACGPLTPGGFIAASQLDPINTEPDKLALAITIPQDVRLDDGDAVLRIAYAEGQTQHVQTEVPLAIARRASVPGVQRLDGETIYLGRLEASHAEEFSVAQRKIRDLRSAGSDGTGTLQIEVTSGCRVGPPLNALPVSTWLRTDPDAAFVQLTRRVDVLERFDEAGVGIPAC